ncbi:MAG: hypothetical protein A3H29_15735 [Acidobacteria bacterium RIFCSPLOWO2_02_FULL_67_21]|nr:MAG: hypothetical protein A3H29_15735 [Acidobacteria bacterium RIFCSPLOWO2_02_FULL_67_21]
MRYPVTLTRDTNNTYLVRFPDVPGAVTYGETIRDAMAHARDAFLTVVDALIKDRKPVPAPSPIGRRQLFVVIPAREAAKIELYRTMQAKKVGKAELGRRLDVHLPQIDRLLNMRHGSQIDQIEAAFGALGKRIDITVSDATERHPARERRVGAVDRRAVARPAQRAHR